MTAERETAAALQEVADLPADADAPELAEAVGLRYVSDDEPGVRRVGRGRGFSFEDAHGHTIVRGSPRHDHVSGLAIPPAWSDVWICPDPRGHVQAVGRDAAGRKQYIYHDRWISVRDATKFHRMGVLAHRLPAIRDTVDGHLRKRSLSRHKVLALLIALLDETLIRVGNDDYARVNGSHGLTTLRWRHVDVDGSHIHFHFTGKGGDELDVDLRHPRLARHLLTCEEIPGQRLFAYEVDGGWRDVDSGAVNDYLEEIAGERITAKDFRTWGGTVVAAEALHELPADIDDRDRDKDVLAAIDAAADRLGNTRAIARSSYVDPRLTEAYRSGRFEDAWDDDPDVVDRLSPTERAVERIIGRDAPGGG